MLIATFITMLCLTLIGFYVFRDPFAPNVVVPGIWTFLGILAIILHPNYYPIDERFLFPLNIWVMTLCITSYFVSIKTHPSSKAATLVSPNQQILKLYTWACFVLMPIVIGVFIWVAFINDPANFFRYLRIMNTGIDDTMETPNIGPLQYIPAVAYITLLISLVYSKNKKIIVLLIIINALGAVITMAKTIFLCIFFATLFILYKKNKVKIKSILIGLLGFVLFSMVIQNLRLGSEESATETVETNDFLSLYLLSSPIAFNYHAEPSSTERFGEHTFRMWYAIENSLGISNKPASDVILSFVSIPDYTNTYTIMYPFYVDFGMIGIIFFAIVYGAMFGYLYKKMATGGTIALVLYAAFVSFMLLEGIGEFIFTNLSQTIQYILFSLIPFVFHKKVTLWKRQ